jgi:dihydrofolate reductase
MVIGGAQVYELCLPFASRIHLTLVHARIGDGDTRFAAWRGAEWIETARVAHAAGEGDDFDHSFITLDRRG